MNRRDEQIAGIISRSDSLDASRLAAFYALVRDSYMEASIVDQIARVEETEDRSPSDFRVFNVQELRRLSDFNDSTYVWDMYCRELGRLVARREEEHLFEVIQEQVPDEGLRQGVEFEGLLDVVNELSEAGYVPDNILAPIAYMVGLTSGGTPPMEWDPDGRTYLRCGGYRLEVYWSSRGRPLDRFIIFDSSAGTWMVKRDPHGNGGRLTVAIGQQVVPVQGVLWIAETVAKYQIEALSGYRSFRPDVPPDRDFDAVR